MARQDIFNQSYESVEYLAQGFFGIVASVKCRGTNELRAIKILESNDPTVMREINLLAQEQFHHENIIRYYGSWIVETARLDQDWRSVLQIKYRNRIPAVMMAIELELCKGDLYAVLNDRNATHFANKEVSQEVHDSLIKCMKQVAQGLKFLHSEKVVHRDIKPANILYDFDGNWKISDLGLARLLDTSMTPRTGTPLYFAPEQMQRHYDSRVDVFAFGLIIFEICYPIRNFEHHRDCFKGLRKSEVRFPKVTDRLSTFPNEMVNLIEGMLKRKPEERTPIETVITSLDNLFPQVVEEVVQANVHSVPLDDQN